MTDINKYEYVVITTGYLWITTLPNDLNTALKVIRSKKINTNGKMHEPNCAGQLPNGTRKVYTQEILSLICACLN